MKLGTKFYQNLSKNPDTIRVKSEQSQVEIRRKPQKLD